MATILGLPQEDVDDLRRVALMHDIGKLAISNRILDKPARLTDAEFARVREHPVYTQRVLEQVSCFRPLAPIAGAHHERLDGSGYPRGLGPDELSVPARVLAVADVYEALTANRPYRPALSDDDALDVIRLDTPDRLDGEAVGALEVVASRWAPALEGLLVGPEGARGQPRHRRGEHGEQPEVRPHRGPVG